MKVPVLSFLASGSCLAGGLFTAPFGPGGTWNLYQFVETPVTWNDAKRLAEETRAPVGNPELTGHLVTFSNMAENEFMRFIAARKGSWCGLTDDERFGAHEAASHPRDGWRWVTGEPLTFANWRHIEPDEMQTRGSGQDAVVIDDRGKWGDRGIGAAGQEAATFDYIVEWETHMPEPVEGATPYLKAWPDDLKMPEWVPGNWSLHWVTGYYPLGDSKYRQPWTIREAAMPFTRTPTSVTSGSGKQIGRMPWLWIATQDANRQGWLPDASCEGVNFPDLPQRDHHFSAIVGKVHVETSGAHTFAISAEEAFCLRIGGLKWKSSRGDGSIDPLDPLTVAYPFAGGNSKTLAVIDLPAGDHLVEALWMVESAGSEFHVLSAPGEHVTEGATTDWRPLGHPTSPRKVPMLGITEAGWTVECSMGIPADESGPELGLQDGLIKLELDLGRITRTGLPSINFADAPETFPAHFPDASVFPNHRPGGRNEHWPLKATARLVVPEDGLYRIGLHAAGRAALRIKGAEFNQFPQLAQGLRQIRQSGPDCFDFDGQVDCNQEPKIVSEWMLKKGEHDIEVFYVKNRGPGALAVFASSSSGPYAPGLLTAGGAKLADDVPGLPHAAAKP